MRGSSGEQSPMKDRLRSRFERIPASMSRVSLPATPADQHKDCSGSPAFVSMMQSTDFGKRDDLADRLHRPPRAASPSLRRTCRTAVWDNPERLHSPAPGTDNEGAQGAIPLQRVETATNVTCRPPACGRAS